MSSNINNYLMNIIGRTYVSDEEINKCALSMTITTSREALFLIWFLRLFHRGVFANATRVSLCKPHG